MKRWKDMAFQEKIDYQPLETNPRKSIINLQNIENKEKQFRLALEFCQCLHDPPLTKKEWEIFCEICDVPGFEEIFFPKK